MLKIKQNWLLGGKVSYISDYKILDFFMPSCCMLFELLRTSVKFSAIVDLLIINSNNYNKCLSSIHNKYVVVPENKASNNSVDFYKPLYTVFLKCLKWLLLLQSMAFVLINIIYLLYDICIFKNNLARMNTKKMKKYNDGIKIAQTNKRKTPTWNSKKKWHTTATSNTKIT